MTNPRRARQTIGDNLFLIGLCFAAGLIGGFLGTLLANLVALT